MKIYLVRHGETQAGVNGSYGYSAPLTGTGRIQALRTGESLSARRIDAIVSSDAVRAVETAEPLCSLLGLSPVIVPALKEIDIGLPADGVTPYEARDPKEFIMDCSHQGGETWDAFRDRVLEGLGYMVNTFDADASIAVFTHAGVKSVALDHYSGRELSSRAGKLFDNGSISTVHSNGSGFIVHSVNDISHLA